MTDAELAEKIRSDGIDVLVDLTLHMAYSRLLVFARKPAPVQATWLGYVGTTGLTAMDYRISDPYLRPARGGRRLHEQTIRLPHCNCAIEPLEGSPEVGPLARIESGACTFACFK